MGIGINGEETMYYTLAGDSTTKIKYAIFLRYYNFNPSSVPSDCETAVMEFEIQPVSLVIAESNQYLSSICSGENKMPVIPQLSGNPVISSQNEFEFTSNDIYTLHATDIHPNYFQNYTFQISAKNSELAHISVEIGQRFLTGDLAIVLQLQTNESSVCSTKSPNCQFGFSSYNSERLEARVPSGNYTLTLYEPLLQNSTLSPCAAFNFKMSIKFVEAADVIYNCPGTMTLPVFFTEHGYLDSTGHMHILDDILLGQYISSLNLEKDSIVRFSASSEVAWVATIYNSTWGTVSTVSQAVDERNSLLASLPNGSYYFTLFYSFEESSADVCQSSRVEFQITPHLNSFTNNLICPFSGIDSLPNLPDSLPTEYLFPDNTKTFYSFQTTTGTIWSYNFSITENSHLIASVSNHFLSTDLVVKLQQIRNDNGADLISVGSNDYNFNRIEEDIAVGSYSLSIYLPANYANPHRTCYGFNFAFALSNSSVTCQGINLDKFNSLNNFRFLRSEKQINFHSPNFLVPPELTFNTRKTLNVSVIARSSFRVYVAPHDKIDIDLFLYSIDNTGTRTLVTRALNGFKGEETIVATLEVGTLYQIELPFWNWDSGSVMPECSYFDMEIDVSPLNPLPQVCQNGAHWPLPPPVSGMPTTSYFYSNIYEYNAEQFYYQQSINKLMDKFYPFTLDSPANIYVRLQFDFTSTSLLLKLIDQSTGEVISYGQSSQNRNEMRAKGVPAGNYTLVITETIINNKDIIGCSYFNYIISVEKDNGNNIPDFGFTLPSTLDSLPYLAYNNRIEMNDYYTVYFPQNASEIQTTFTIHSDSLLRVSSFLFDSAYMINISLSNGNDLFFNTSILNRQLSAGTYTLTFTIPFIFVFRTDPLPMNLQLVIAPLSQVQQDVNTYTPISQCNTVNPPARIQLSNSGYYTYNQIQSFSSYNADPGIKTIASYDFQITQLTVLFTSAEANFLTNFVEWSLLKDGNLFIPSLTSNNINQIDRVIEAGNYTLSLNTINPFLQPQRCILYRMSIYIRPYNQNDPHADCSDYDMLPIDLNSDAGGSVPYGGPINNGQLELSGSNFLFPTSGETDYINMTLSGESLVSIYITTRSNLRITNSLLNGNANVNPYYSLRGVMSSVFRTYYLNPTSATNYAFTLSYNDLTQFASCPIFALDLSISKKEIVQSLFLCPPSYSSTLPPNVVTVNDTGFAHQSIRTYIPSTNNILSSGFNITLNITRSSRLQLSLSFYSKLSYFNLTLFDMQNNRTYVAGLSLIENKNRETDLRRNFNIFLRTGVYIISLSQSTFDTSVFAFNPNRIYCIPFEWELFLVPIGETATYATISPPSSYNLSPISDITVTATFARNIFDQSHKQITSSNLQPLYNSIHLVSIGSDKRAPTMITAKSVVGLDNRHFTFVFDHFQLAVGTKYQLQLMPDNLYDSANNSVIIPTSNTYSTIDPQCGGHGNLDSKYVCQCSTGYAGVIGPCSSCDIGYNNVANSGDPIRCVKDGSEVCKENSCGCSYTKEQPDVCIPLGSCDDTSGKIVCNCSAAYKGNKQPKKKFK